MILYQQWNLFIINDVNTEWMGNSFFHTWSNSVIQTNSECHDRQNHVLLCTHFMLNLSDMTWTIHTAAVSVAMGYNNIHTQFVGYVYDVLSNQILNIQLQRFISYHHQTKSYRFHAHGMLFYVLLKCYLSEIPYRIPSLSCLYQSQCSATGVPAQGVRWAANSCMKLYVCKL
jgi:hypothetical protein